MSAIQFVENQRVSLRSILCFLAAFAVAIALQISKGFVSLKGLLWIAVGISLCTTAFLAPSLEVVLPDVRHTSVRRMFCGTMIVYLLLNLLVLHTRHDPIDVILFENDSARAFLHGSDPYGRDVTHEDLYTPNHISIYPAGITGHGRVHLGFPYPPLTLLSVTPAYVLGDVRYSFLVAVGLTAALMFYLSPNSIGLIAATLLLFLPETPFVLSVGFTDPLVAFTLAVTVVCAIRAPRWLPIALGLFLVSKQYTIVVVPLTALLLPKFSWKAYFSLLAGAGAVVAAVTLPFLFWDVKGFWYSVVGVYIVLPFRPDALSFSSMLVAHRLPAVPQWLMVLVVALANWLALKKSPRTPSGFALSAAFVSLIFFALNRQAFCGYYFYCVGALCMAFVSTIHDPEEKVVLTFQYPMSAS